MPETIMEFRETLLAAQRNQQQKSSGSFYKAKFDPPKKEQKQRDRLSANIQKFLAKKDEEERQKKLEAQKKKEELLAMRDPKALRKIQKTLKVIKSANKSVIEDAVDRDNTAVTREGPDQPDQDDYGYESQEAAALYEKMMQKYSKIPDEPKFPVRKITAKKDLNGTRERVKNALQHEDDPVPHKRRRKTDTGDKDLSPIREFEKKREDPPKPEKPKIRKPAPPPMDFNQLLKLAEQKKSEPIDVAAKKAVVESEPDRLMTKRQKREYEEEMARRQRRQERIELQKSGKKPQKEDKTVMPERERKPEPSVGRIPKLSDRTTITHRNDSPKRDKQYSDKEKADKMLREKDRARQIEKDKAEREKERNEREKLERLKAERERIERDIERLNRDRDRLEKSKSKLESSITTEKARPSDKPREQSMKQEIKKSIDLKSQNTYRIDKNSNEKKVSLPSRGSDSKVIQKSNRDSVPLKNGIKDKVLLAKQRQDGSPKVNGHIRPENGKRLPDVKGAPQKRPDDMRPMPGGSKPRPAPVSQKASGNFDFDKHVKSLNNGSRQFPPGDVRRKQHSEKQKRRVVESDSEYDSEMDDFIDDGDENLDYSRHIKEIFGYDKSKYRYIDDHDDPEMESSFARQQREEYISKKIGIMEDLEDMRLEALEKKKSKKRRVIDD